MKNITKKLPYEVRKKIRKFKASASMFKYAFKSPMKN